jgi:hypothetical protein
LRRYFMANLLNCLVAGGSLMPRRGRLVMSGLAVRYVSALPIRAALPFRDAKKRVWKSMRFVQTTTAVG